MTPFPLLRLPLLATEEVLKQLSFGDIYSLSMCSKRSTNMIRLVNTRKYTLNIILSVSSLFLKADQFHLILPKDEQKRNPGDPILEDRILEKLKTELSHVLTTFKFYEKTFFCYGKWTPEQNQSLLETIIRNQGNTFEDFTLYRKYEDMSNQWILKNIKVNNTLTTYAPFARKGFIFRSCPKIWQSFGSSWITLDTLISMGGCMAIEVSRSVLLTVKDIDSFMEMWKADTFPNLEYFYLGVIKWEHNDMILGFTREQLSVKREEMRRKKIGYENYDCTGGVDIQSNGGVNGTLYFNADLVSVSFFVWKN